MSTPSVLQTTRSWGVREASCSPGTPTSSPLEPTARPAGRPSDASRLAEGVSGLSAGQPRRTAPVAERPDRQRRPEGPTLLTTPFMQPNVTRPIQHMWNLHSCCILLQPSRSLRHTLATLLSIAKPAAHRLLHPMLTTARFYTSKPAAGACPLRLHHHHTTTASTTATAAPSLPPPSPPPSLPPPSPPLPSPPPPSSPPPPAAAPAAPVPSVPPRLPDHLTTTVASAAHPRLLLLCFRLPAPVLRIIRPA